jgi:hypothetical protein
MSKKNSKNKMNTMDLMLSGMRLPAIPAGCTHTDRQEKRKKKFDYKSELKHY